MKERIESLSFEEIKSLREELDRIYYSRLRDQYEAHISSAMESLREAMALDDKSIVILSDKTYFLDSIIEVLNELITIPSENLKGE